MAVNEIGTTSQAGKFGLGQAGFFDRLKHALVDSIHPRREVVIFVILACAVPLGYALYTRHIWEDFFITFRHSQNLAEGNGLVYTPGEKVHGFTSPLGTLLPALTYVATGSHSYIPAIWIFRLLSIAAYCVGGFLVFQRLAQTTSSYPAVRYAFAVLFAFEAKSVAYTVNGMETGFMLLFVGWGIHLLLRDPPYRIVPMGLCWAGLMWTRPDGFIPAGALMLGHLVFFAESRKTAAVAILKSGILAAALYAPWVIWAWSYYGSPIPHTILAKGLGQGVKLTHLGEMAQRIYTNYPERAAQVFAPIYYPMCWPKPWWIGRVSALLGIFCSLYWLFPVRDRLGRAASLGFFVMCAYFSYMAFAFPWYLPPAALCGLVVLLSGTCTLAHRMSSIEWKRRMVLGTGITCAVIPVVVFFALGARLMRLQERYCEMGNRAEIGRWLKQQVKPDEAVFLEPLGYIGYFSGARMFDYPGLASPQVRAAIKATKLSIPAVIEHIEPAWVVLRPWELQDALKTTPRFTERYIPVKTFDVSKRCSKYASIPGSRYLFCDSVFHVFRRKDLDENQPQTQALVEREAS